jgi:nitrite reductase/ring-hydroxylating ferredoxin subunit
VVVAVVKTHFAPALPSTLAAYREIGRADLGAADDLEIGHVRRVDVGGRTFALFRLSEVEYALTDGLCTHGQTHLSGGPVIDCRTVECPKHNCRFDVRTGEPTRRPAKAPLSTHTVEVIDGRLVRTSPPERSPRSRAAEPSDGVELGRFDSRPSHP